MASNLSSQSDLRRYVGAATAPEERTRLVRFVLVGGSNTLITLLVYSVALHLGVWYPIAAGLGYAAGIVNGYTWNRTWTFETGTFHLPEFSRYVVVQVGGLGANVLGLTLAVEILGMGKLTGELVTLAPIVLVSFILNRWWIFRPRVLSESG
jgi:putative flippase GtrA